VQVHTRPSRQRPLAALILKWLGNGHGQLLVAQASPPAGCSGVSPQVLIPPPVPETRTGTVPEPAAEDGCATPTGGGTAERLHHPRGADGQILQNQRCLRPLAALILKWLGNGHGAKFVLRLSSFE